MGKIRKFACPACQSSWTINIGHGLRHATLENVLKSFPADIQQKIKETATEEQLPLFEFNYCAALCPQCKTVVSVPVIRFLQTSKSHIGICPDCGVPSLDNPNCRSSGGNNPDCDDSNCGEPVFIIPDDTACLCPHCEKAQLSIQDIGSWD